MICRDCGHCGTRDGKDGCRVDDKGLSWCRLHQKHVHYWRETCPDNDGLHYDPEYDDEPEHDFDDEQY